jgi:hypothetical protein
MSSITICVNLQATAEPVQVEKKEKQVFTNEDYVPAPLVAADAPIFQKTQAFVKAVSTTTIEKTTAIDVGPVQKISERRDTFLKATSVSHLEKTVVAPEELGATPRHQDRVQAYSAGVTASPSAGTPRPLASLTN